jgi:hypothetical protein
MSTPDMIDTRDIEERLRAALTARADLVQPEDLAPLAPVVELKPRWQWPWVLLATAAVVLLVLGVVLQGVGGRQRSDDVAPKPDEPQVVLPDDIGRDWKAVELSTLPKLDLDGDGVKEKVVFLGEPTEQFDGRLRMQTTLSSTGDEAYGIAEIGTTLDTNVLDPIDADRDGDEELVLYYSDPDAVGGGGYPLVFDLRDGLLVQAVPEDPDLLVRGQVPVPGSTTEFYEMVRIHDYWFEGGRLFSSRSRSAFASGNMTLLRGETVLVDAWEWHLDEDGVLRAESVGCRLDDVFEGRMPCDGRTEDEPLAVEGPATDRWGVGEGGDITQGYRFSVRLEPGNPPYVVVSGDDGRTIRHDLGGVADPQVATVQPFGPTYDGASVLVTSGSDPDVIVVLGQEGERLVEQRAVGEVPFGNGMLDDGRPYRSWMTSEGGLVTAVGTDEEDRWQILAWQLLRGNRMTALPRGEACIAELDDPAAGC